MKEHPDDIFNAQLAEEMAKRTDKLADTSIDIAIRVKQAREFIAWSSSHWRGSWTAWLEESNKAVGEMNLLRMAFDRETKAVTAAAKDVRDFFSSPEYSRAHDQFKESIELLERFGELKRSGTLDAFADFILKVQCNAPSKS